jgi:hypothetical protein
MEGAMQIDRQTAIRRLTNRWIEQCEFYPTMRDAIPLKVYLRANLPFVLGSPLGLDVLAQYNNRG